MLETRQTMVLLAGFIMLMGVLGYTNTLEIEPVMINGFIALITIFLGSLLSHKNKSAWHGSVIWLSFISSIYIYQIFGHISDKLNPEPESKFVFVGMTMLALATLYRVIKAKPESAK